MTTQGTLVETRNESDTLFSESLRGPIYWGIAVGMLQAAAPLALRWLDQDIVWAVPLAMIASIYVGFAVADGRTNVIAVEIGVASVFVALSFVAISASPWWAVVGLVGHGLKDLWQHRTHFVSTTRWWPPFCMMVDFVAAAIIAVVVLMGLDLNG